MLSTRPLLCCCYARKGECNNLGVIVMNLLKVSAFFAIFSLGAPAQADVPIGLWQSPPDKRGIVLQVRTRTCGAGICGQVERVKDRRGYDAPSRDVGRAVLVNLVPEADGTYAGDVWEPARGALLEAKVKVKGNRMVLHKCNDTKCRDEVWRRVR